MEKRCASPACNLCIRAYTWILFLLFSLCTRVFPLMATHTFIIIYLQHAFYRNFISCTLYTHCILLLCTSFCQHLHLYSCYLTWVQITFWYSRLMFVFESSYLILENVDSLNRQLKSCFFHGFEYYLIWRTVLKFWANLEQIMSL